MVPHRFGGFWTTAKLEVLKKYLSAYTDALKKQPFRKIYIDAFAGTGSRIDSHSNAKEQYSLFPELTGENSQELHDGSAKIALNTEPPFDEYNFIEIKEERCKKLLALREMFPDKADKIKVYHGDANKIIQEICQGSWFGRRAVLFLDPYGMQVEWSTIDAIASTKAIDLWVLSPLAAINRLLPKSGKISSSCRKRLDKFFGTKGWHARCYQQEQTPDFFGNKQMNVKKISTEGIGRYYIERLKESKFAGVIDRPGELRNTRKSLLYLLCFAVGNPRGKSIAIKIAEHIITSMETND